MSHVLGDGGTQVSPGGQWLGAGVSDGTESMKLSLEKIHAEDSVLSFRTPRGCHRKRDRAPCCGPREEGGTHGRHRFCCSQQASKALPSGDLPIVLFSVLTRGAQLWPNTSIMRQLSKNSMSPIPHMKTLSIQQVTGCGTEFPWAVLKSPLFLKFLEWVLLS